MLTLEHNMLARSVFIYYLYVNLRFEPFCIGKFIFWQGNIIAPDHEDDAFKVVRSCLQMTRGIIS